VVDAPKGGYLFLDKVKFPASFAGDVDLKTAAFVADSQVPWGIDALGGIVTEPVWKSRPSWYLQVRDDKMVPYPAQQFMAKRPGATVVEVPGSHAIYVSNPNAVAALIDQAANGVKQRCAKPGAQILKGVEAAGAATR
jgi:pimeloyl-ACP methyl ester carboxylesterase